jgi:hypothetical protein
MGRMPASLLTARLERRSVVVRGSTGALGLNLDA